MITKTRNSLADKTVYMYQFTGRHAGPGFVPGFFRRLCQALDPVKVPPDCINPAMLRSVSRSVGIPAENLLKEENHDA